MFVPELVSSRKKIKQLALIRHFMSKCGFTMAVFETHSQNVYLFNLMLVLITMYLSFAMKVSQKRQKFYEKMKLNIR